MTKEKSQEQQRQEEVQRIMDWVEQYGVDTESFAKYTKK